MIFLSILQNAFFLSHFLYFFNFKFSYQQIKSGIIYKNTTLFLNPVNSFIYGIYLFTCNVKVRHNLIIFLDDFSTSFRRNSTGKIVRWFEEFINLNHLTVFVTEFHQKLVEKLSKKIQLSLSYSSLLGRYVTFSVCLACSGERAIEAISLALHSVSHRLQAM